jgi:hypothetical protein
MQSELAGTFCHIRMRSISVAPSSRSWKASCLGATASRSMQPSRRTIVCSVTVFLKLVSQADAQHKLRIRSRAGVPDESGIRAYLGLNRNLSPVHQIAA